MKTYTKGWFLVSCKIGPCKMPVYLEYIDSSTFWNCCTMTTMFSDYGDVINERIRFYFPAYIIAKLLKTIDETYSIAIGRKTYVDKTDV